jgi:hypothetical protein
MVKMAARPIYRNPFAGQQQVRDLEHRYLREDSKRLYSDQIALSAGEDIRGGKDLRGNFQKIFRWKLESFLRFEWVLRFPDEQTISDGQIKAVVESALDADSDEPRTILEAIQKLDDLPSVGIPVASAFLTALHPCKYTVIDRQAYNSLSIMKFPNSPSPEEYLHYLFFCRQQAYRLGVSLRSYDRALWQQGSEIGR